MECYWCKQELAQAAVVCPHCRRERKDFHDLKVMTYTFSGLSIIPLINGILGGAWDGGMFSGFELDLVFKTFSGWAFIGLQVFSLATYIKASKIIGTWWWW